MNTKKTLWSLFTLTLLVCQAESVQPETAVLPAAEDFGAAQPKQPEKDKKPPEKKPLEKKTTEPTQPDIFDPSLFARGDTTQGFNPHMMGDFPGIFARQTITLIGLQSSTATVTTITRGAVPPQVTIQTNPTVQTPVTQNRTIVVPAGSLGPIKIADNASPMPTDRAFVTWNYFDGLRGPQSAPIPLVNATNIVSVTNTNRGNVTQTFTTTTVTVIPGMPQVTANLNREVFGFEKTFLDGRASIELRSPVQEQTSSVNGFGSSAYGDMTIIGKYAFMLDRETGNVLSGGLAVTVPTGPNVTTIAGDLHTTFIQPWFGYIWNRDLIFVHAFHSIAIPTDSRDTTLLFNDVGVNLWLYRAESSRILNFVVPMAEIHVTTPLDHRDANSPITVGDLVVFTGGVHIGLFRNTTLSLGVATPITGPRLYNVEAFMQLNWRF